MAPLANQVARLPLNLSLGLCSLIQLCLGCDSLHLIKLEQCVKVKDLWRSFCRVDLRATELHDDFLGHVPLSEEVNHALITGWQGLALLRLLLSLFLEVFLHLVFSQVAHLARDLVLELNSAACARQGTPFNRHIVCGCWPLLLILLQCLHSFVLHCKTLLIAQRLVFRQRLRLLL